MKNIAIIVNKTRDDGVKLAKDVCGYLTGLGASIYADSEVGGVLGTGGHTLLTEENAFECDAAVVIGGDGTMLKAFKFFISSNVALLGINLGKIGFLSDADKGEYKPKLDMLMAGEYKIEERMMVRLCGADQPVYGDALNEVMFKHVFGDGVGEFKVYCGKVLLGHYFADGVLISTPTGSTAYSLSAGGPVVSPESEVMIIQPIAPHSFCNRSIVVGSNEEIYVSFAHETTNVCLDGEPVSVGEDTLKIIKSAVNSKFVRFDDYNFYELLFSKIKEPNYLRGGLA